MTSFKFFAKIEKAYQENEKKYIQGIASGTLEDRDGERVSLSLLEKFVIAMPLHLTDAHAQDGVFKELGTVVKGEIKEEGGVYNLHIIAELDNNNVAAQQLWVNITEKGKKYGFSIEAQNPKWRIVFSELLGRDIREYYDAEPKAISVTTAPSYYPSVVEAIVKSMKKNGLDNTEENNNIKLEVTQETAPETTSDKSVENISTESEKVDQETTVDESQKKYETAKFDEILQKLDYLQQKLESQEEIKKSYESSKNALLSKIDKLRSNLSALELKYEELKKSFNSLPRPKKSIAAIIAKNFDDIDDPRLFSSDPEERQQAVYEKLFKNNK